MGNQSKENPEFYIKEKKEFIVTFPVDYKGLLTLDMIVNFFSVFNQDTIGWDFIVTKEKGHLKGDIHDHFHVYLRYKGPNRRGFTSRGHNASRIWDIKLPATVYKYVDPNGNDQYCFEGWRPSNSMEKFTSAHPNIKFKGDKFDPNCKNTKTMIRYVTKDPLEIKSNFDWESEIKEEEKKKRNTLKDDEFEFCCWLRQMIIKHPEYTKKEVQKEIMNNEKYAALFLSKYINYKQVMEGFFKENPTIKPKGFYRVFRVPIELYNYLNYLDNWVKNWHDPNIKEKPDRPLGLYLQGGGKIGKTRLFAAMGDFSYWCNLWSYDNYEFKPAFNFFDDYDAAADHKNNQVKDEFVYLKPWFGGQQVVSISGKWKSAKKIQNGKPLIFISNYSFEERFPNKKDREYILTCCKVVELGNYDTGKKDYRGEKIYEPVDLYTPKNSFNCGQNKNWVIYDTRKTWWYQNKILPTLQKEEENNIQKEKEVQEEASTSENQEDVIVISDTEYEPTVIIDNDGSEDEPILIKEESEDDFEDSTQGRRKRRSLQRDRKGKKRARGY